MTDSEHPFAEIGAAQAIDLVEGGLPLIDVRERHEWEAGHAPHAFLIPMSELESRLGELPRDLPILIVCHSGMRSARVTDYLVRSGFQASNLTGGMVGWAEAGGELETDGDSAPRV